MKPKENYSPGPKDLCQTPAYGVEPLAFAPHFGYLETVWEPASGEGYLVKALRNHYKMMVRATDVSDGFDFLVWKPTSPEMYDCIITNPPFSLKREFTSRCYELEKPWALLMPAETIGNKWFIELANQYSPKPGIIWISPRINFKMPNEGWNGSGSQFNIAWFTWNMGFEGNIYKRMEHWTKEYRKGFEI